MKELSNKTHTHTHTHIPSTSIIIYTCIYFTHVYIHSPIHTFVCSIYTVHQLRIVVCFQRDSVLGRDSRGNGGMLNMYLTMHRVGGIQLYMNHNKEHLRLILRYSLSLSLPWTYNNTNIHTILVRC